MKEKEIKKPDILTEEKSVAKIKVKEENLKEKEKMSPIEQERREMKTGEPGAAMTPFQN